MNAITMDITRLLSRAHHATPSGIDRFELQYAVWARSRGLQFVETVPSGPISVRTRRVARLIGDVQARWSGASTGPTQSDLLQRIFAAINGEIRWKEAQQPVGDAPSRQVAAWNQKVTTSVRTLLSFRTPAASSFVHVSHTNLHRPTAFSWLEKRQSHGVFYLHDLIPLTHPEFVRPAEPPRHLRRMETILRYANLVLCNSQTTADSFRAFARKEGREVPEIAIIPPGVEPSFNADRRDGRRRTKHPYFLVVGTIEPRKNHMLLLQIWRELVERLGSNAPRLVIVGKRGWENTLVFAMLDRSPQLRDAVIEVQDLGDDALAELMAGAAALLSPSFVEGYGMPVAEALAVGTPVIASDIPSHREIASARATFLNPTDGPHWHEAIRAHTHREERRAIPASTRWDNHFDTLEELIRFNRTDPGRALRSTGGEPP
ncbi:glycosyltransferase family 4 protein [Labrys neptuniae]